jgi:uncharacterized Fe-S cluster protein YjdI
MGKTKEYSNGEVTVVWKPDLCIHSENCFKGLPSVFDPDKRPWIDIEGASTSEIVEQVKKCPSGALSTFMNNKKEADEAIQEEQIVEVAQDGPLMVYGNIRVKLANGDEMTKHRTTAFCRCGASSNKPFCDGSHKKIGFKG